MDDNIPPEALHRIRARTMAEVARTPQDGGYKEATDFARGLLIALAISLPGIVGIIALIAWWLA